MNLFQLHTPRLFILILILAGCMQRSDVRERSSGEIVQNIPPKKATNIISQKNLDNQIPARFGDNLEIHRVLPEPSHSLPVTEYEYYIPVKEPSKAPLIQSDSLWEYDIATNPVKDDRFRSFNTDGFFRNGRVNNGIYLTIIIDNDLFDYTDYYYTSGQTLEFFHPAISASPISYLLPGTKGSINYHSISLTQNMYTPRELEKYSVQLGDRPFASYLILSHNKYSLQPLKRMRLESRLDLGVIGPKALGQVAQDIFHSNEPVGWVNQISNDFVLNYGIKYEKGFYRNRGFEMAWFGAGQAGTLFDNITGGLFLQIGKTNGRYESLFQTTPRQSKYLKRLRYYANLNLENKLVFYDATLQGGIFSPNDVYTIPVEMVQRYVFTGKFGFGLGLGPFTLEAEQVFLTPEFEGGRHHFWFRIKSSVLFN